MEVQSRRLPWVPLRHGKRSAFPGPLACLCTTRHGRQRASHSDAVCSQDKELEVYIELPGNTAQSGGSEPYPGSMIEPQAILSSKHGCIFGTEELQEILAGREAQLQQVSYRDTYGVHLVILRKR